MSKESPSQVRCQAGLLNRLQPWCWVPQRERPASELGSWDCQEAVLSYRRSPQSHLDPSVQWELSHLVLLDL